jgi:hypothetical protein
VSAAPGKLAKPKSKRQAGCVRSHRAAERTTTLQGVANSTRSYTFPGHRRPTGPPRWAWQLGLPRGMAQQPTVTGMVAGGFMAKNRRQPKLRCSKRNTGALHKEEPQRMNHAPNWPRPKRPRPHRHRNIATQTPPGCIRSIGSGNESINGWSVEAGVIALVALSLGAAQCGAPTRATNRNKIRGMNGPRTGFRHGPNEPAASTPHRQVV